MDNSLHLTLEELPNREALDRGKANLQAELEKDGSRLAALNWNLVRDAASDKMTSELAKFDWIGGLGGLWCKASKLRELAIQTKAAPGTEEPLTLGQHSLSLDLHPVVTMRCGPIELRPVRFTIRLEALVETAILIVAEGKLAALEAAILTPSADLYYGEQHLSQLAERKIPIAQRYTFSGGGLDIPGV